MLQRFILLARCYPEDVSNNYGDINVTEWGNMDVVPRANPDVCIALIEVFAAAFDVSPHSVLEPRLQAVTAIFQAFIPFAYVDPREFAALERILPLFLKFARWVCAPALRLALRADIKRAGFAFFFMFWAQDGLCKHPDRGFLQTLLTEDVRVGFCRLSNIGGVYVSLLYRWVPTFWIH